MNNIKGNFNENVKANESFCYERNTGSFQCESHLGIIEECFNKKYQFRVEKSWTLPPPEQFYSSKRWQINKLQKMKVDLNNVKSKLNEFDISEWSLHTKLRDRAGFIFKELRKYVKPELLTQAWCKFYECLSQFPLFCEDVIKNKYLNSLHLCEAPGAFVCALNHFLVSIHPDIKWNWLANSLNPEYEGNDLSHMIPDKRLMNYTKKHWLFGADKTGDVTQYYNYEDILKSSQKLGNISLVTADGSVDCMSDPGEQENLVGHLHFCEVVLALSVLAPGTNIHLFGTVLSALFVFDNHQKY